MRILSILSGWEVLRIEKEMIKLLIRLPRPRYRFLKVGLTPCEGVLSFFGTSQARLSSVLCRSHTG